MLAVASLAVGVVASLTAPSAHAGVSGVPVDSLGPLNHGAVLDDVPAVADGRGVSDATGYVTGTANGLVG